MRIGPRGMRKYGVTMETTKKVPLIIMTMLTTNNCQRRSSHLIIAMQLKKDRSCCEIFESITSMSDVNLIRMDIREQTTDNNFRHMR